VTALLSLLALTAESSLDQPSISFLMKRTNKSCQAYLAWEPNPVKNQVGRYLVRNGANLPNSVTEDIRGFSLCPQYSNKQLRRIEKLNMQKVKFGHHGRNPKGFKGLRGSIRESKEMLLKRALTEEAPF